jgi:hypothetical protein
VGRRLFCIRGDPERTALRDILLALLFSVAFIGACFTYVMPAQGADYRPPIEEVTIRAAPRVQLWAWRPATVSVEVKVKNISETLFCSGAVFLWGDGSYSYHEADCDPYELPEQVTTRLFYWRRTHQYKRPGEYAVEFCFVKNNECLRREAVTIEVR